MIPLPRIPVYHKTSQAPVFGGNDHARWPGHPATGDGFQAGTAEMCAALLDLAINPLKVIEKGDGVAVAVRISGTHHSEFFGEKPTGRAFEVDGVDVMRVGNGKLCLAAKAQNR